MPVIDLEIDSGDQSSTLQCDVCIIGSGPAGCTIARECSDAGLKVTMLESGGFERSHTTDMLNEVESIGRPRVLDQWAVRNRIVGGSSHTWGGRCAAFDVIDFEARPWVPDSGWPFELGSLEPYLERTAPYLGLAVGQGFSDERFWTIAGRKPPRPDPDPKLLLPFFWQFSRDDKESYPYEYMRFGRDLGSRLGPNVSLVVGATVVGIRAVPSGRAVRSVEFAAPDGRRRTLSSATVVLCAGGIENARLLLSSDDVMPGGLGNGSRPRRTLPDGPPAWCRRHVRRRSLAAAAEASRALQCRWQPVPRRPETQPGDPEGRTASELRGLARRGRRGGRPVGCLEARCHPASLGSPKTHSRLPRTPGSWLSA